MRTRLAVGAIVASMIVVVGSPALAGGVTLDFDREWYMPGDIATGVAETIVHVEGSGWLESGPYYAYLAPNDAQGGAPVTRWPEVPPGAITLGALRLEPVQSWSARVSISFEIPDVPAGQYSIFHCNDPCTTQVGDFIGGWLWIGTPPPPTTTPPPLITAPATSTPQPAPVAAKRAPSVTDRDDGGRDWVPWVGATALVAALALVAGGLHLASRRRA